MRGGGQGGAGSCDSKQHPAGQMDSSLKNEFINDVEGIINRRSVKLSFSSSEGFPDGAMTCCRLAAMRMAEIV